MKLNAKIMLLVCIGLMVCVSAASACHPSIGIDKTTNGADGQEIVFGTPITWTYTVTNLGDVKLKDVTVTDDKGLVPVYQSGDTNGNGRLDIDETWIFTASGSAELGSYSNIGTATGSYGCETVTAEDCSSYNGIVDPNSFSSVPEFPTVALPAAFIVGLVGVVLFIKGNKENE